MRIRNILPVLLACGLCAAGLPAVAMSTFQDKPAGTVDPVPHAGTVTVPPAGGTITIDRTTYLFNPVTAKIHDAAGRKLQAFILRRDTSVKYVTANEGKQDRIIEIWTQTK